MSQVQHGTHLEGLVQDIIKSGRNVPVYTPRELALFLEALSADITQLVAEFTVNGDVTRVDAYSQVTKSRSGMAFGSIYTLSWLDGSVFYTSGAEMKYLLALLDSEASNLGYTGLVPKFLKTVMSQIK